jgi:hypothetical protein
MTNPKSPPKSLMEGEKIEVKTKPKSVIKQLTRHYIIEEKILIEALQLEGKEIISMGLYSGLSPNDEQQGKTHDKCKWEIYTKDVSSEVNLK